MNTTRNENKLHPVDLIIYAIAIIVMAFALYQSIAESILWLTILTAVIILLVGYLFSLTPRAIELTPDMIRIFLWLGKEEFPFDNIASVEHLDFSGNNIRLCGTSGYKARIGWFKNSHIGIYKAYITDSQEGVLITLKSGEKRAFSVDHSEQVIAAIRAKIDA